MKKSRSFFISFFILLIFAGAVFFIGWTQFKVPQGSVGIMVSKTSGVCEDPITSGKFSWHWEFLIPMNASIRVFETNQITVENTVKGSLPSAELYSKLLKNSPDFSYLFTFSATLKCTPNQILFLVKNQDIKDNLSLETYVRNSTAALSQSVKDIIVSSLVNGETNLEKLIDKNTLTAPEGTELVSFFIKDSILPDIALYQKARTAYNSFLEEVNSDFIASNELDTTSEMRFVQNISRLEKLGSILQKYPEIIELLKSDSNLTDILNSMGNK